MHKEQANSGLDMNKIRRIDKLRKYAEEGKINTRLCKENKATVGVPYYENLISRQRMQGDHLCDMIMYCCNDIFNITNELCTISMRLE